MKIYIVAGETSGDRHAAALMQELVALNPDAEFFGAGGPKMREVGGSHLFEWTQEAVVGLWDVLLKLQYFRKQFYRMYREIVALQPATVILVDYPGFNLRLARYLHRHGFPGKLIYYVSPQVWAWNRGRIPKMAKFLDRMLCIFPFEKELYEASGLKTDFVGHPMAADLSSERRNLPREPDLIGLFPGSREREVRRILPRMLQAAERLLTRKAELRFEISAASERLVPLIEKIRAHYPVVRPCSIGVRHAPELMQKAFVGMVASGTATMEASYFKLPFVLLYLVSWFTFVPGRLLVRIKHLGMPNILAGRTIIPEYIQHQAIPQNIADAVWRLYSEPTAREAMIRDLDQVTRKLGEVEPGHRAAQVVLRELEFSPPISR